MSPTAAWAANGAASRQSRAEVRCMWVADGRAAARARQGDEVAARAGYAALRGPFRRSAPAMPHFACCLLVLAAAVDPERLARDYAAAVEAVNRAHADKPVAKDEQELAKKLPAS